MEGNFRSSNIVSFNRENMTVTTKEEVFIN